MKIKSILSSFIFLVSLGAITTSCEDMLTPDMERYTNNFSGKDTVYFYTGILRNVQNMVEQNQLLGDLRSDLVTTTDYSNDSISNIINYNSANNKDDGSNMLLNRAAYYKVINQCNFYLAKVDTMAVKNNIYYMKREYAQVVNIRAWAYLQLVQTYGEVPFITVPVDNANTGWEKTAPKVNADNLVDHLKDGLQKSQVIERTLGYPQYGEFETGNSSYKVKCQYLRFYSDIVLGDLYLLRGNNKADYVNAAKNYYHFLKDRASSNVNISSNSASFGRNMSNGRYFYTPSVSSWVSNGNAASENGNENITLMPSAANSSFGQVLTRSAQIFGFDPHSTDNTTDGSSSGKMSLSINYRSRQVAPSNAFVRLCQAQTYSVSNTDSKGNLTTIEYYDGAGDARLYGTCPYFETTEGGRNRYIVKASPTSNVNRDGLASDYEFKHYQNIYRLKQIYLRYAEAINRAGYPRIAYLVLNSGINNNTFPTLRADTIFNDPAKTYQLHYVVDSAEVVTQNRAAFFVGVDEIRRAQADPEYDLYLNFNSIKTWGNSGIHEQGSGRWTTLDSINSYDLAVAKRVQEEAERTGTNNSSEVKNVLRKLRTHADNATTTTPSTGNGSGNAEGPSLAELRKNYTPVKPVAPAEASEEEINAVETLISDECALETAYEGTRMFDLIRVARHKNAADGSGTQWLAWKIARRNLDIAPYENVSDKGDGSLYNLLLNEANWYIVSPKY